MQPLRPLLMTRIYYYGCWNDGGHSICGPGCQWVPRAERAERYAEGRLHIDGTLAPRRHKTGRILWTGQGKTRDEVHRLQYESAECDQGEFLRHKLDFEDASRIGARTSFTVIQWWDRTQCDTRSGSNSSLLVDGDHPSAQMLVVLAEHFPQVLSNLQKAGVSLVERRPDPPPS
jgi:hypothetical protein